MKFGYVRFIPPNDRASGGRLDENGKFTLGCFAPKDGAVVGTHKVTVEAGEAKTETTILWHAPKKYKDVSSSGLMQTITESVDNLVIDLKTDGKKYPYTEKVQ